MVWSAADLPTNLLRVLERRIMDGERAGCEQLPLASRNMVSLDVISAFISGELDDARMQELIWGLVLIGSKSRTSLAATPVLGASQTLPRQFALLKLLFLSRPLIAERRGDDFRWRFARNGESGITIRPEPRTLPLLRAGRVAEACCIAARRLRSCGLPSIPGSLPDGTTRDSAWREQAFGYRAAHRLAAALLFPISSRSADYLVHLVCREQSTAAEAFAVSPAGELHE